MIWRAYTGAGGSTPGAEPKPGEDGYVLKQNGSKRAMWFHSMHDGKTYDVGLRWCRPEAVGVPVYYWGAYPYTQPNLQVYGAQSPPYHGSGDTAGGDFIPPAPWTEIWAKHEDPSLADDDIAKMFARDWDVDTVGGSSLWDMYLDNLARTWEDLPIVGGYAYAKRDFEAIGQGEGGEYVKITVGAWFAGVQYGTEWFDKWAYRNEGSIPYNDYLTKAILSEPSFVLRVQYTVSYCGSVNRYGVGWVGDDHWWYPDRHTGFGQFPEVATAQLMETWDGQLALCSNGVHASYANTTDLGWPTIRKKPAAHYVDNMGVHDAPQDPEPGGSVIYYRFPAYPTGRF